MTIRYVRSWLAPNPLCQCIGLILAFGRVSSAQPDPAPVVPGTPRITCSQPAYDFGTTHTETNITHTFTIENKGDVPLHIRRVRAPCGCITTALPTNAIPPGQAFPLTMTIALRGQSRTVRNTVIMESNDPQRPHYQLEFTGKLLLDIDVYPRAINFGAREPGESAELFADIMSSSGTTFRVTGLKIDSPAFSGTLTTNVPGRHYQLNVRAHPGRAGSHDDAVARIFTDHPKYPSLAIGLYQYISSDIVGVPRRLILYVEESASPPPRYVAVASRLNKPFAISAVELPLPEMFSQIIPEGPARYRVVIKGGVISEALNDKYIVIKTDRPGMDPIRVPISVRPHP